jgi:hypothetical protein
MTFVDLQTSFNLALSFTQALAWPLLIGIVLTVFRKELRKLLQNVESAKGFGIETTFFQNALDDPTASEETKDAVAKLWRDVSATRGEPAPQPAIEQLNNQGRSRGKPVDGEIAAAVSQRDYEDQIRAALKRAGDGKVRSSWASSSFHFFKSDRMVSYGMATASLVPQHGVGMIHVLASLTETPMIAGLAGTSSRNILVVTPFKFEIPGVETATWESPKDDEALADCLERLGAFDYVVDKDGETAAK